MAPGVGSSCLCTCSPSFTWKLCSASGITHPVCDRPSATCIHVLDLGVAEFLTRLGSQGLERKCGGYWGAPTPHAHTPRETKSPVMTRQAYYSGNIAARKLRLLKEEYYELLCGGDLWRTSAGCLCQGIWEGVSLWRYRPHAYGNILWGQPSAPGIL